MPSKYESCNLKQHRVIKLGKFKGIVDNRKLNCPRFYPNCCKGCTCCMNQPHVPSLLRKSYSFNDCNNKMIKLKQIKLHCCKFPSMLTLKKESQQHSITQTSISDNDYNDTDNWENDLKNLINILSLDGTINLNGQNLL